MQDECIQVNRMYSLYVSVWSAKNPDTSWGISLGCHDLNQVMMQFTTTVTDVLFLVAQFNTIPGSGYLAIYMSNMFVSIAVSTQNQN